MIEHFDAGIKKAGQYPDRELVKFKEHSFQLLRPSGRGYGNATLTGLKPETTPNI